MNCNFIVFTFVLVLYKYFCFLSSSKAHIQSCTVRFRIYLYTDELLSFIKRVPIYDVTRSVNYVLFMFTTGLRLIKFLIL